MPHRGSRAAALIVSIGLLASCATPPRSAFPERSPTEVRAQLVQLLPKQTPDREGWAADIQGAFAALDVPPSTENLCAALAVTEQESTFVADPVVPNLARIARAEIDRRAANLHVPQLLLRAALDIASPNGRTYAQRLAAVRTEKELSTIYEDFIGEVPMGKQLFADKNPVRTGGPMQVGIAFAERHASRHRYPYDDESIRRAVFTRRGGMYFGIAHLLDYPSSYDRHIFRYADFNAGWYASRNAAFQAAVTAATGTPLALDGDLVVPGKVGATERAVRSLAGTLGMSETQIRRALDSSDRHDFERTDLYSRVFEIAERKAGRALPRAVVPRILLKSPKITRKLTTEWFANRVQDRYQRCVNKAFGL